MFDSIIQKVIPFKNLSSKEKELLERRRQEENHNRRTGCRGCVSYGIIIFVVLGVIIAIVNAIN